MGRRLDRDTRKRGAECETLSPLPPIVFPYFRARCGQGLHRELTLERRPPMELRHNCRNTRSISLLLRNLLQEERKSRPSRPHGILIQTIRRRARHDLLRQLKGCVYTRGLQWSNSLSCPVSSRICCECRTAADGA